MSRTGSKSLQFDEVGDWSELKLEILRKYASAYSAILASKNLHHVYIEGFAGAGRHISRRSRSLIPGSPQNALSIKPPFEEYHLIDLNSARAEELRRQTAGKPNVQVYCGDSNEILISQVFPKIRYEEYKRGLCILDPYGLHLNWKVIATAANLRTIEIFLNFPILDMNRNVQLTGQIFLKRMCHTQRGGDLHKPCLSHQALRRRSHDRNVWLALSPARRFAGNHLGGLR